MQEGTLDWYRATANSIVKGDMQAYGTQYDLFQLMWSAISELDMNDVSVRKPIIKIASYTRNMARYMAVNTGKGAYDDLFWAFSKIEAPHDFESYMFYIEKNRSPEKKFYMPREKTLRVVVQDLQALEDREFDFYGLELPPRVGKAVAFDTPVLTDKGWKQHGDLTLRDRVIGADGKFKRILAIHDPCEMEYEVTFSDGERVVCHGNHEWHVYDRHTQKVVDIETKSMIGKLWDKGDKNRCRFQIPIIDFIEGEEKHLAVGPYTLGAWLGDGRNTNPDICGDKNDYAIVQKMVDEGYEVSWKTIHHATEVHYYGFHGLRQGLQTYGMCHSRERRTKHIPSIYLSASKEQRLWLLAGLLDTDGSLRRKEHRYDFTTNEPALRDSFIALVSTFGWRTSVTRHESGYSKTGIHANKPWWTISFNPTCYIPCQLERKQLHEYSKQRRTAITDIQPIKEKVMGNCITVEDGLYRVGNTLKITHNSTVCEFFISHVMGKRPNSHNAMSGHSGMLADGFYGELKNIINTQEYTFAEIFPGVPIQKFSAEKKEITLGDPDRFATMTCRGIEGTWTGAVDISSDGYLYVDDLVRDREESLSPTRLEGRYQDYLNVLVDRKNDGSRELMVGTRWNVFDPLGRLEAKYKGNPRYRFRKIPALNAQNESNFDYQFGKGFSTEYYLDMRAKLDKAEWMAKFQQEPFIREGLLFPEEELRYSDGIIRDEQYRVVAACDPAFGGGDSVSMPICVDNGDKKGIKPIIDWVFTKDSIKKSIPLVIDKIIEHEISYVRMEKNNGGELYAKQILEGLKERNYNHCKIDLRNAPTRMRKEEKIVAYSDYVKERFAFLLPVQPGIDDWSAEKVYKRSAMYDAAIAEMTMFVSEGKNPHDDAADGITQLAMIFENKLENRKAEVVNSPI